ncbi:hypothetical protein TNCV_424211 [Trichonephila clavipes]|nr:hypothetical protein TNCV_424211 [Trichonephila clavipes]
MEAEHAFQVYLIQYQGVHLSDYITFMTEFRIIVNGLQPPEIIDLHTEQRIGELLTKVFPDHHSLDILRIRAFARSEPKDVSSDYVEQEASKGKEAFIQALWMPNPAYTVWHIRLGNDRVRKTSPRGLYWLKRWMLCREMARYRVSSPRRMLHLSDALARKDTLWP